MLTGTPLKTARLEQQASNPRDKRKDLPIETISMTRMQRISEVAFARLALKLCR